MIQSLYRTLSGWSIYPESDGKPMTDNTIQAYWIMVLFGNLLALFRDRLDVFVAADLLWFPVEGDDTEQIGPDVLVVFGRPKGDRSSYRQWEEDNVPVTVVFEILSPNNTPTEMADKLDFYDRHGVLEYYYYDPQSNRLLVYLRRTETLTREHFGKSFVSPRLGIRFELTETNLRIFHPDGRPFRSFEQLEEERQHEQQLRLDAQQQATLAQEQASQAQKRAARLAELSRKVRRSQASPEEVAELERLEEETLPPTP